MVKEATAGGDEETATLHEKVPHLGKQEEKLDDLLGFGGSTSAKDNHNAGDNLAPNNKFKRPSSAVKQSDPAPKKQTLTKVDSQSRLQAHIEQKRKELEMLRKATKAAARSQQKPEVQLQDE